MAKTMKLYPSTHKICFKTVAISIVMLMVLHDVSSAAGPRPAKSIPHTLSAPSGFVSAADGLRENATFLYLGKLIREALDLFGDKISVDGVKDLVAGQTSHVDLTGFLWREIERRGNTLYLPCIDENSGKRVEIPYHLPGTVQSETPAASLPKTARKSSPQAAAMLKPHENTMSMEVFNFDKDLFHEDKTKPWHDPNLIELWLQAAHEVFAERENTGEKIPDRLIIYPRGGVLYRKWEEGDLDLTFYFSDELYEETACVPYAAIADRFISLASAAGLTVVEDEGYDPDQAAEWSQQNDRFNQFPISILNTEGNPIKLDIYDGPISFINPAVVEEWGGVGFVYDPDGNYFSAPAATDMFNRLVTGIDTEKLVKAKLDDFVRTTENMEEYITRIRAAQLSISRLDFMPYLQSVYRKPFVRAITLWRLTGQTDKLNATIAILEDIDNKALAGFYADPYQMMDELDFYYDHFLEVFEEETHERHLTHVEREIRDRIAARSIHPGAGKEAPEEEPVAKPSKPMPPGSPYAMYELLLAKAAPVTAQEIADEKGLSLEHTVTPDIRTLVVYLGLAEEITDEDGTVRCKAVEFSQPVRAKIMPILRDLRIHPTVAEKQAARKQLEDLKIGIEPFQEELITKDEILERVKKRAVPWGNVTTEARLYIVELLAEALGKKPGELNSWHFYQRLSIFGGRSVQGLLVCIMEEKGFSGEGSRTRAVKALKDDLGIEDLLPPPKKELKFTREDWTTTREILRKYPGSKKLPNDVEKFVLQRLANADITRLVYDARGADPNSASFQVLYFAFKNVALHIIGKTGRYVENEILYDALWDALERTVRGFKEEKGVEFISYFGAAFKNRLQRYQAKRNTEKRRLLQFSDGLKDGSAPHGTVTMDQASFRTYKAAASAESRIDSGIDLKEKADALREILSPLGKRERNIRIFLRYYFGRKDVSFTEIAKDHNVTRDRVRQISNHIREMVTDSNNPRVKAAFLGIAGRL
ncbi:MAG: sigma-70 family RNA polymerase sigma factor, partial [Candidatus Omnitrophota bacterium]